MGKCEQCGAEVMLPFECNFCGGNFCKEHRLPENHNCVGVPAKTPLGNWRTKLYYKRKKDDFPKGKEIEVVTSEGPLHIEKKRITVYDDELGLHRKEIPLVIICLGIVFLVMILFLLLVH